MRNIVGQTPRGDDFFKREHIIKKIYRRLDAGNHLFLSAPRRAGKTSIMRYLEDFPKDDYAFIYIETEDIKSSEDFFKLVAETLLISPAIEKMTRVAESSKSIFKQFTENISKIKVWNFEVQLNKAEPLEYKQEVEALMQKLDTEDFKIVIMLDEFPVTVEHIKNEHGEDAAINFLHANRRIRQQASRGIQFIYTGSIGLASIVGRLKATKTINDLNILEITPLSIEEATEFAKKLLDAHDVQYPPEVLQYMLAKLEWLMPFFIQLIIQMLIDEYEETQKAISNKSVDSAFAKASSHRSKLYFEDYLTRLDKTLPEGEAVIAKSILLKIAQEKAVSSNHFEDIDPTGSVTELLILDGYINDLEEQYRFNSPILRDWWKKYAQ